jgi:hypothetical protein
LAKVKPKNIWYDVVILLLVIYKIKMIVNTGRFGYPWLAKPKPNRTISSHVNPLIGPVNPFFLLNPARFGFLLFG